MLNYDLFRLVVAPEYAAKTNNELDVFANEAEIEITVKVWKTRYDRGVALITAHLIAMSERPSNMGGNSATGQLIKTKVGDLERQFGKASNDGKNGSYDLTTYGAEFLRLRRQVLKGPVFVGM